MLLNIRGKRLWIMDETGEASPVRRHQDIYERPRGRRLPDWWVVEKAPDWRPPTGTGGGSLLRLGMTQNEDDARRSARRWPGPESDPGPGPWGDDDLGLDPYLAPAGSPAGGPAKGMKIGAGHKPQAYDAFGRYTGPRGGAMPMGGGPLGRSVRLFGADSLAGEAGRGAGPAGCAGGCGRGGAGGASSAGGLRGASGRAPGRQRPDRHRRRGRAFGRPL